MNNLTQHQNPRRRHCPGPQGGLQPVESWHDQPAPGVLEPDHRSLARRSGLSRRGRNCQQRAVCGQYRQAHRPLCQRQICRPRDRFGGNVWWGVYNRPIVREKFEELYARMLGLPAGPRCVRAGCVCRRGRKLPPAGAHRQRTGLAQHVCAQYVHPARIAGRVQALCAGLYRSCRSRVQIRSPGWTTPTARPSSPVFSRRSWPSSATARTRVRSRSRFLRS
jgi:hypothetical protein